VQPTITAATTTITARAVACLGEVEVVEVVEVMALAAAAAGSLI